EFTLASLGPSFWIDASTSPMSAIVRETGMQTFSAHASKGFYRWADLLGLDFIKTYSAKAVGKLVDGIFHDGKVYWRLQPDETWRHFEKGDIMDYLNVTLGASTRGTEGQPSQLRLAVQHIQL